MKTFKQYILEKYEEFKVKDLEVTFTVEPSPILVEGPSTYSESDMQIYLQDRLAQGLPSDVDNAKELFGKNADNIYDAWFDYDKFEHIQDNRDEYDIKWDMKYDQNVKPEDNQAFRITGLKFKIGFEEFTLKDDSSLDIDETLKQVFNNAAKPIDLDGHEISLSFDEKSIKYTK